MRVAECHPQNKYGARGMCCVCYNKWLRTHNPDYGRKSRESLERLKEAAKKKYGDDYTRHRTLVYRYQITLEEYEDRLIAQGYKCAICGKAHNPAPKRKLHVDHCHATGKVRGLLCARCNGFMGTIDQDRSVISALIDYIVGMPHYVSGQDDRPLRRSKS